MMNYSIINPLIPPVLRKSIPLAPGKMVDAVGLHPMASPGHNEID
jgi:hypothetical protein